MESNPYAAPRAAVADRTPEERKRPVLVWIITIFMAFGVTGGIISSVLALSGNPIGGQVAADYMRSLGIGPLDHVYTIIVMAVSAAGYVYLFRLRTPAVPILAVIFAVGLVHAAVKVATVPAYRAMFTNVPSLWTILAGWTINLLILGYIWWLYRKGVLR